VRFTKLRKLIDFIKAIFSSFSEDNATRLAAAIAYYAIFALAPLLIIAIAIIGLVFGKEAAQDRVVEQFQDLVGEGGADAIRTMIVSIDRPRAGIIATVTGVAALMFGAGNMFLSLQDSLNTIWEVTPKPGRGIRNMIRERFLSFAMVLGTGFLLLVSLLISTGLAAFSEYLTGILPELYYISQAVNLIISLGIITLLFAMIFKVLPDVIIAWSDVWIGAAVTALLFTVGKYFIGLYLGHISTESAYGAAGSLVILLLWVYYSALILLLGSEFTQVYANRHGSRVVPAEHAMPLTEEMRSRQGMSRTEDTGTACTGRRKEVTHTSYEKERTGTYVTETEPLEKSPVSFYTLSFICLIAGMVIGNRNDRLADETNRKEDTGVLKK
jgi:membrane protein